MSIILAVFVLTVTLADLSQGACPNIISRTEWGARPGTGSTARNPRSHVVIHHSDTDSCSSEAACKKAVKSFQNYHMDNKGWEDIAYNFLVGEDGNVYEGCGWTKIGTHAKNYNTKGLGICFIGRFNSQTPNAAALQAAQDLIECGVDQGKIRNNYSLVGHRQVKTTDCPGNNLYDVIKNWPRFTTTP